MKNNSQKRTHISFSELKIWNDCPFKHKLIYIDKVKEFKGSEHTAFGTAMHYVCENLVIDPKTKCMDLFNSKFIEELKLLKDSNIELDKKLVNSMRIQASQIVNYILPALKNTFNNFEVVSVEEELMEKINDDLHFKGFIDLVIKKDDMYHVIDWKTCSWGWDSKRKADRMTTYQLTLYKYFFALKHNIDPSKIDTHFALLKRTAKKNNVEIFKVTSGAKKTDNALKLLNKSIYNIKSKNFIKNRISCTSGYGCEFYNTKHCMR